MKYIFLSIIISILGLTVKSQNNLEDLLSKHVSKPSCQVVSSNIELNINRIYKNDSINEMISFWQSTCGETEPLLRLKIVTRLKNGIKSDSLIALYFDTYSYVFFNRVNYSNHLDYGKIFNGNPDYYNYIPLRSKFDTLVSNIAQEVLENKTINKDEQLICLMYSFQIDRYWKLIKKKEYRDTKIAQLNRIRLLEYKGPFSYKIKLGTWMPINDPNNTFGINPQLGIGFGFQNEKIQFDISMDFRINVNDKEFNIKANSDTIGTDSDMGLLIGARLLYKFYKKGLWTIYPACGIGWDVIDTDVKKINSDDEDDQYHDIGAINLNVGINIMYDVLLDDEIGFGINYHYVPYSMDHNYYTSFSSDYLTFNLIYKF